MALHLASPFFYPSAYFVNSLDNDFRGINNLFKSLERSLQGEVDEHERRILTPNYQSHTDEHGTQTIEIEMPGVKKDEISVDLDKNGRVVIVTGNRYGKNKSCNAKVEEKSDEKDDDDKKQEQNVKENTEKNEPAIVYKWKGYVDRMAQTEDVQAEYCGDGVLRIVLQGKKKTEPMKIQIRDA